MARKKAPKRKPVDENVVLTERRLRDRDELLAFQPPVEANKDYISRLPTETIHGILSYIILDHDAGRGVKITTKNAAFKDQPHVLLSISTLSKHFHANVESFSLHYLTKHKALYSLKTAVKATADSEPRRSARLALKPKIDTQAHRAELVRHLQTRCFQCNLWCGRRALMASGVACCLACELALFPRTIIRPATISFAQNAR